MNIKSKWVTALGVRRVAVLSGVVGLALGAAVLTGGSAAMAAVGSEPGNLTLNPPSGPTSTQPTWSTSDACPAGFQTSAQAFVYNPDGTVFSNVSPIESPANAPFVNMALNPGFTMALVLSNITAGQTAEIALTCYSGPSGTGNSQNVQSTFATLNANGTYSTSGTGPSNGINTSTVVTASPTVGTVGVQETLTATETGTDGTHPAGSVQFTAGGTNIGTPVTVDANGVATANTTPSAPGTDAITAVFTPSVTGYNGSTGSLSLVVNPAGSQTAGTIPIQVTVPATGALTVTVAAGTVTLNVTGTTPPLVGTGTMNNVTVSDTRNTSPGWSVSGQESVFTNTAVSTDTIAADQLGWVPTAVNPLVGAATLGGAIAPGTSPNGLGDAAQTLAQATAGNGIGTNTLSANLTLDIPAATPAGVYTGNLTITYLLSHA